MRVIAGHYRGRTLRSPQGLQTRPTSDRLRETLFNILAPRIEDARFLDLCAGSGAVGIESVSRGASFVTFVDRSRKMCALIEANLDLCGIPEEVTEVVLSPAAEFIRREDVRAERDWDLIYFDPPYESEYAPVLKSIAAASSKVLRPGGMLIAEHYHKNNLPDEVGTLRRWRLLKQGETCLSFYERE